MSLEIYVLAELQRIAQHQSKTFLWYEPTTWDCAVLPGLGYKPDHMWLFGPNFEVFEVLAECGARKIDPSVVRYALQLEIVEESRTQHSKQRGVSDAAREAQIRNVFAGIPLGFVYVTVAHQGHKHANRDDIFFRRREAEDSEFEVIANRALALTNRMQSVVWMMQEMFEARDNGTKFVGK